MRPIHWLFVFFISIFSIFIHSRQILVNPPSLFSDEVDAGYQAFVFNSCGNDYFGNKFPTHFQSFSDWRTPLYIYSVSLAQKLLGPTETSVRLPSLIFGLLSILVFSLIIHHIFQSQLAFIISFVVLSLNPWLFHYSRTAFEATGMILSLLLAIYLWLLYLQKHQLSRLLLSVVFFAASFYFYATAKLFVLTLVFPIFLIWRSNFLKLPRVHLFVAVVIASVIATPLVVDTIKGRAGFRFSYISIFTEPTLSTSVDYARYQDLPVGSLDQVGLSPNLTTKFFHNKISHTFTTFIRNYISAFSTDFLVLRGDSNLRQGFGEKGNFYYLDLVFCLVGLVFAFSQPNLSKYLYFFLSFLLLAPVPFALTRDVTSPQSTRLILMLIPLMFFIVLGIMAIIKLVRSRFIWGLLGILYLLEFSSFIHYYNHHYPLLSARSWHYGMKTAVLDTTPLSGQFGKIFYGSGNEPFLPFFYFYTHYLPSSASCNPVLDTKNYSDSYFSGKVVENKFFFGPLEWSNLVANEPILDQYLFVISSLELSRLNDFLNHSSTHRGYKISYQLLKQPLKIYPDQEVYYYLQFQKKPV